MLHRPASAPAAVTLAEAMRDSPQLGRLSQRLRTSKAMFVAISPLLPPALTSSLRPGPIDEEGWSLLCANAAVAAKLRQLVPLLESRLRDAGYPAPIVRIKVLPA